MDVMFIALIVILWFHINQRWRFSFYLHFLNRMYIVSQAIDVPNTVHAAVSGKMVYGIATFKNHFHTTVWKSPADKNLKTATIITNLFMSSSWMSKDTHLAKRLISMIYR